MPSRTARSQPAVKISGTAQEYVVRPDKMAFAAIPLPRPSVGAVPGNPCMVFVAVKRHECNASVKAPISANYSNFDPSTFLVQNDTLTVKKRGMYLVTGTIFMALYDTPSARDPSRWGSIQQSSMHLLSPGGGAAISIWTDSTMYGGQTSTLRFADMLWVFQDNDQYHLRSGATYGRPGDHPVTLQAEGSFRILRLQA
jgi:hypothetical protein